MQTLAHIIGAPRPTRAQEDGWDCNEMPVASRPPGGSRLFPSANRNTGRANGMGERLLRPWQTENGRSLRLAAAIGFTHHVDTPPRGRESSHETTNSVTANRAHCSHFSDHVASYRRLPTGQGLGERRKRLAIWEVWSSQSRGASQMPRCRPHA